MSTSIPTRSEGGTTRASHRLCSPRVLQRLYRYATGSLRLAAIDADHAGLFEAGDVVNALLEQALQGTLRWTLDERATDDELVAYACAKLNGRRSTLRRKAAL